MSVKNEEVNRIVHSQAMCWYRSQPPKRSSEEATGGQKPSTITSPSSFVKTEDTIAALPLDSTSPVSRKDRHVPAQTTLSRVNSNVVGSQFKTVDYKPHGNDQEIKIRTLVDHIANRFGIVDTLDSLVVLPCLQDTQDTRLDADFLMRNCKIFGYF